MQQLDNKINYRNAATPFQGPYAQFPKRLNDYYTNSVDI